MANIFRKTSLDRLSSPEQLETLITITSPRTWMAVICIGLVLACAVVWGVFGRIPIKVDTSGILISSGGNTSVEATVSGQVTDIRVGTGDEVKKGDVLIILASDELVEKINKNEGLIGELESVDAYSNWSKVTLSKDLQELQQLGIQVQTASSNEEELQLAQQFRSTRDADIRALKEENAEMRNTIDTEYNVVAPYDGKVSSIFVSKGDLIKPGSDAVTIAKTGSDVKALEAVFYVPVSEGKKLKEGMEVKIYPTTVQKEEYGYMKATIVNVPEYPVSGASVLNTLGNEALAKELTGKGAPLEIHAELVVDSKTVSGYAWSSGKGKNVDIQNGTFCQASVVVDEDRPICRVIPILKQKAVPIE